MCGCVWLCVCVCVYLSRWEDQAAVQGLDEVTFRGGPGIEITERKPWCGGLPRGNPSFKADTDDHILIETNVPIRRFISHILCHTLAALICICPFIFLSLSLSLSHLSPPLASLSPPCLCVSPSLPFCSVNLFIITRGPLAADRQLMCSAAPQTLHRADSCHTLIASFKSQISQDQLEINT